jgi:hypothetical protein
MSRFHVSPSLPQMQGVQLDPAILSHLLGACVAVAAWDLGLQLCTAAFVAQVGAPRHAQLTVA